MVSAGDLATADGRVRLGALVRATRAAVVRRAEQTAALHHPELASLVITDQRAGVLLDRVERFVDVGPIYGPGAALADHERSEIRRLRTEARASGIILPSDALIGRGIEGLDLALAYLIAAPDLEPSFAGLFGYLLDVVQPMRLTEQVAVDIMAADADDAHRIVTACRRYGSLLGDGLIERRRAPDGLGPVDLLVPADGLVELLRGASVDNALIGAQPEPHPSGCVPTTVDRSVLADIASGFAAGAVDVVAVRGVEGSGREAVAQALASSRPVVWGSAADAVDVLQRAAVVEACAALVLAGDDDVDVEASRLVARSRVPTLLVGEGSVRLPGLWTDRNYAEIDLATPTFTDTRALWARAFPALPTDRVDDLAARFRLLPDDVDAVFALDRTARGWATNGRRPSIERLAAVVTRRGASKVADVRTPTRTPDMLILPPVQLAQVRSVASSFRAWPRVADAWDLGRFGNPGVTALFTGDPGTGKTLAAEVIAGEIGVDLMVVDLSRLVSKWIGETEKNLDRVFSEAEASNCMLFFDEADSVFGARGEVSKGSDRYANLEVGYLLQRLELYVGLVVLASNLRGNLDNAFTRRFHHVVHFPAPAEDDRRRIWDLMLARPVVVDAGVDTNALAALELTGSGIASVVRGAALSAHADDRDTVTLDDLVVAVGQQYQREARLVPGDILGTLVATS